MRRYDCFYSLEGRFYKVEQIVRQSGTASHSLLFGSIIENQTSFHKCGTKHELQNY